MQALMTSFETYCPSINYRTLPEAAYNKIDYPSFRSRVIHRTLIGYLIAALIFSPCYYSAPIFLLQFKEFELYWGAVLLRLEEEYWRSPFFKSILLE